MLRLIPLATLLLAAACGSANAVPYRLAHTFQRENPEPGDFFGTAVVLEGGVAAIKSDSSHTDGDGLSVTHVFEQSASGAWNEAATLEFDSGNNEGNFFIGQELAIDNGEILIGYGPDARVGSPEALQFAVRETDGWSVEFNELADDPTKFRDYEPLRLIGRSVDISGDYAIASDPFSGRSDPSTSNEGVARIFKKQADGRWREAANLFADEEPWFNADRVALDGTTAVVAERHIVGFEYRSDFSGGLYFFERSESVEWALDQSILTTETFISDVRIDGDTSITRNLSRDGDLQIYERTATGWELTDELSGGGQTRNLGLAVEGDLLAYSLPGTQAWKVDVYRRESLGQWRLLASIDDPAPELNHRFGASIAIENGRILIGTTTVSPASSEFAGAAYLFVPVPEPSTAVLTATLAAACATTRRRFPKHSNPQPRTA